MGVSPVAAGSDLPAAVPSTEAANDGPVAGAPPPAAEPQWAPPPLVSGDGFGPAAQPRQGRGAGLNAPPMAGGAAQSRLADLGATGGPDDPRREINTDLEAISRATDALVRM